MFHVEKKTMRSLSGANKLTCFVLKRTTNFGVQQMTEHSVSIQSHSVSNVVREHVLHRPDRLPSLFLWREAQLKLAIEYRIEHRACFTQKKDNALLATSYQADMHVLCCKGPLKFAVDCRLEHKTCFTQNKRKQSAALGHDLFCAANDATTSRANTIPRQCSCLIRAWAFGQYLFKYYLAIRTKKSILLDSSGLMHAKLKDHIVWYPHLY